MKLKKCNKTRIKIIQNTNHYNFDAEDFSFYSMLPPTIFAYYLKFGTYPDANSRNNTD